MITMGSVYEELNSVKKGGNELKDILVKRGRPVKDEDIGEAKKSLFENVGS